MLRRCIFTGGQFFGFWLFFSILLFSATCISLVPETPPTALILDVPSGGSSPLLPQDPLPSADAVTEVTLKTPQVGLPPLCVARKPVVLKVWPQPAPSPGNLLEMQICRRHPRTIELETLERGPAICALTDPPGDLDAPKV